MDKMEEISSLCKRRGFIYPGSQIYGGLANTWDYGPLGVAMLKKIKNLWWNTFIESRDDIYGIETGILMNPKVWQASGHTESFTDALIDCRSCKQRTRADHLIEQNLKGQKVEGKSLDELEEMINKNKIKCQNCNGFDWTKPREFNLLFETHIGIVPEKQSLTYLRGETAQGMFINFKNILDSFSPKIPFGIAQVGKAFRNEITKGHFIFRTLEFEQMEIEYFIHKKNWKTLFSTWKKLMWNWTLKLGISEKNLRWRAHTKDEISHYSLRTEDIEYDFPFGGFKELYGLAYRTDYDLKNHMEKSGQDLRYFDIENNIKFIPHVIEPTFGLNRTVLAVLFDSFEKQEKRIVLKLNPLISPFQIAVFPLLSNKAGLVKKAKEVYNSLKRNFSCTWDGRGNIGKRYFSQDEIGTPWCITVDFDSLKKADVTVRDRNTTKQVRIKIDALETYFRKQIKGL